MALARRAGRSRGARLAAPALAAVLLLGLLATSRLEGAWMPSQAPKKQYGSSALDGNEGGAVASREEQQHDVQPPKQHLQQEQQEEQEQEEQEEEERGAVDTPTPVTDAIRQRCAGTLGSWCVEYWTQPEVPARTAPRGNKQCSLDCNQVGVCNALSGLCTCPAGWTGFNCLHPMKRYCTHKFRDWGFDPPRLEPNYTEALGPHSPSTFQFTVTHCAGFCDEDIAMCYCPTNTTYGHIPAPVDAPQGSPPVRRGRPMPQWCQPNTTKEGQGTAWGMYPWEELFGPEGWCQAENPQRKCSCFLDGLGGETCNEVFEQFCFNQCNGRGECQLGYCKCDTGWHGIDCAHRSEVADASTPGREAARPWLAEHVHTPAAQEFAAGATRRRPLIHVYELPSDYTTLLLQYRDSASAGCVPRHFGWQNETYFSRSLYNLEGAFLEILLQSEHRTLNPEEADFFYVPVFTSCWIEHVRGNADSLRDTMYGIHGARVHGATNLLLEAFHWVQSHHPYWDRRGGRDHIWLVTFDEASCYVPSAIRSSIILSQWGRKDLNHTTNTGYWEDEYSVEFQHPHWEPKGFLWKIAGHACYDPVKDLVLPSLKVPDHFRFSPLVGAPTRKRVYLAFHRGRVQLDNPPFSRGIRQRLAIAAEKGQWLEKHNIAVGETENLPGEYSEQLASSVFCLYLPGDGWSARLEDAMLHGCIPAIIIDDVDVSFESILDYFAYTIRIPQADAEKLPEILLSVSEERRAEMRGNLVKVWQRYMWSGWRPWARAFRDLQAENARAAPQEAAGGAGDAAEQQQQQKQQQQQQQQQQRPLSQPTTVPDLDPSTGDDAFGTVMAWLYSRIPATR